MDNLDKYPTPDSNPEERSPEQPDQLSELIKIIVALLIVTILAVTTVMLFLRSSVI